VAPGAAADLVLLGADPHTTDAQTLRTMPVVATVVGGRVTHGG
jgi:predicted amidohydrolase YtcJ